MENGNEREKKKVKKLKYKNEHPTLRMSWIISVFPEPEGPYKWIPDERGGERERGQKQQNMEEAD